MSPGSRTTAPLKSQRNKKKRNKKKRTRTYWPGRRRFRRAGPNAYHWSARLRYAGRSRVEARCPGCERVRDGRAKEAGRYSHAERDNHHQHTILGADRAPFVAPETGQELTCIFHVNNPLSVNPQFASELRNARSDISLIRGLSRPAWAGFRVCAPTSTGRKTGR